MIQKLSDILNSVGYDVIVYSDDQIVPVESLMDDESQKIVIFDDFICDKNQKPKT